MDPIDDTELPTAGAPGDDDFPDEAAEAASRRELEALLSGVTPPRDPATGKVVQGRVVQIGAEEVFLDIGAKSEAVIDRAELTDKEGRLEVQVGDTLEASVVSTGDVIRLSRGTLKGAKDREALLLAHRSGVAVEGRVEAVRKGGFDVALAGGVRAFCPLSQIDERRTDDASSWVGRSLEFRIVEMDERARNVVVSRRRLLEDLAQRARAEARSRIAEGAVLKGRVASLQGYGAFIDLGGVQGLLHVSEIAHARPNHPSELLKLGEEVTVQVLKIEEGTGKISLTMKQLAQDPWATAGESVRVGDRFEGKVKRVAEFGAFVELVPGIDGLVHASELAPGRKNADARKLVEPGATMRVKVTEVDLARRRIGLARVGEGEEEDARVEPGQLVKGRVERVEGYGVFLRLGPGQVGLVPNEELGTTRGADYRREFPVGSEMAVEVLAVEEGGRKIRLSRARALTREDRDSVATWKARAEGEATGGGFSTLGEAFKKTVRK